MTSAKPAAGARPSWAVPLGNEDPFVVMASTPDRLRKLLRGLTERQLAKSPAPGKWSIQEIVAHLADGEVILGSRYRFIAAHDRPAILASDQDAFAKMLGPLNAKTSDLLDDFAMARAVNLGLFDRLPPEAFARVGLHSERGEESLLSMIVMYAGHDLNHLSQVETIVTGLFPKKARKGKKKRRPV